jgi:hypothetical protein
VPAPRTQVRPPTVGEVARRAHVSQATVSRVLNRYPHVRSRVRSAVQQAMRALGYRPDQLARSFARRETQTLGLIVADITNPFYAETPRAAVEAVRDRGCNVILCNTDSRPRLHEEYVEVLRGRRGVGSSSGPSSSTIPSWRIWSAQAIPASCTTGGFDRGGRTTSCWTTCGPART